MIDDIFHMFLFPFFMMSIRANYFIKNAAKRQEGGNYEIIFKHYKRGPSPFCKCSCHVYHDNRARCTTFPILSCMGKQYDIRRMSWHSDVRHKCVCTKGFY